jgi:hypothetical protein
LALDPEEPIMNRLTISLETFARIAPDPAIRFEPNGTVSILLSDKAVRILSAVRQYGESFEDCLNRVYGSRK